MPDYCAKTRYVQHTAYALTHRTGRGNFLFLIQHLFFYPVVTLKDTTSEIVLKVLVKSEIYESLSGMSRMSGKEMLIYCQAMERPVTCGGKEECKMKLWEEEKSGEAEKAVRVWGKEGTYGADNRKSNSCL